MSKNEIVFTRAVIQTLFLTVFISCLSFIVNAQDKASAQPPSPLKLQLEIQQNNSCLNSSLTIVGKLENGGNESVIIDKRNLWRFVSFKGFPPDSSIDANLPFYKNLKLPRYKVASGDHFEDEDIPKEYLLRLKPKEYYQDTLEIPLSERFFQIPGKYSVKSAYKQYKNWSSKGVALFIGEVESNELEFNISNCEKAQMQLCCKN
jgi:hypothetical protein